MNCSFARPASFAAALFLAASPLVSAQSIELKPQWVVGKKYSQTMNMTQETSVPMGDQEMKQKMNMTMEMSTTVRQHEDGKRRRLNVTYERVAMDMEMMGQKMSFDSAKPGGADALGLGKSFGAIVGKEMKIIVNDKDEVEDIENYNEVIGSAGNPMAAQMFDKASMSQMIRQGMILAAPGKPVKPGDSWPVDTKFPMGQLGNVAVKGNYLFKSMGDRDGAPCAELAFETKMSLAEGAAGGMGQMGMKIEEGGMKGTTWFDPKLGIARATESHQVIRMTMKNPQNPDKTMSLPMTQDVSLKLTKVEDIK